VTAAAPNCRQQQAVVAAAVLDAPSISTPSDLASSSNATAAVPYVTPDPAMWLESELSTNYLGMYEIPDLASAQAQNSQAPRGRQLGGTSADKPARSLPRPSSSSEQRSAFGANMLLLNSKAGRMLRKRNRSARGSTRQQRFLQREYPAIIEVSGVFCCILGSAGTAVAWQQQHRHDRMSCASHQEGPHTTHMLACHPPLPHTHSCPVHSCTRIFATLSQTRMTSTPRCSPPCCHGSTNLH
jgi:hypothetical protein